MCVDDYFACVGVLECVCVCMCMCVHVYCVCMCICVCACVCVCMCIHIYLDREIDYVIFLDIYRFYSELFL